jgi:hypothetical protein
MGFVPQRLKTKSANLYFAGPGREPGHFLFKAQKKVRKKWPENRLPP